MDRRRPAGAFTHRRAILLGIKSAFKEEVSVAGISSCFGDNYWLKRDRDVGFPQEFVTGLAQNGWLGICLPEEYGAGLGISVLD